MIKNRVIYGIIFAALVFSSAAIVPVRSSSITQEQIINPSSEEMEQNSVLVESNQSVQHEEQLFSSASWIQMQQHAEHQLSLDELENSVTHAVLTKLAIWNNPHEQTTIYAQHCRRLRYGCERQVRQFSRYIVEVATEFHIDPWLFSGMAWHESRFNPGAESNMGAVGIFQLLRTGPASRGIAFVHQRRFREACGRNLGVCQRPVVVRAAEWFLASIEQCNGSVADGLRAYNSGDCNGPRRYYRAVFEARDELMEIARR